MITVEQARNLAQKAHEGHFRCDGKTPYFTHLERVAARVTDDDEKIVAFLHDSVEDSKLTIEQLKENGVPEYIIGYILLLTHYPDTNYFDYVDMVKYHTVTKNVKLADILDNLGDTPTNEQVKKYAKALDILLFS